MRARLPLLIAAYLLLALVLTWPAVTAPGRLVPGSPATDLWEGMWSVWFAEQGLAHGELAYRTTLINFPEGGALVVADPLGALIAAPWVALLGLPMAWSLLVWGQLAFSGVVAHRFSEELLEWLGRPTRAAWVAGLGYASAPVVLSGVHNGNSEAFAAGWAALAAWRCWAVATGRGRVWSAVLALFVAALGSWYGAVVAFLFAGVIALFGDWGGSRRHRAATVLGGLLVVAPLALAVAGAATAKGNLVGIKDPHETALVRRTTGPSDLRAFFVPGDFRSPDFRQISRYGEDFIHCSYLGYVLIGAALLAARERRTRWLWLVSGLGGLLALGPVLVKDGSAFIFADARAMPMPYLLLERLPGFSSLSLLYRLTAAPALGLALLASVGLSMRRWGPWAALLVLAEVRLVSPMAGLPDVADAAASPAISALAKAPDGAVMNYPVVGGRGYLFEQSVHGHPVAGGLNFPNSSGSRRVWKAMLGAAEDPAQTFRAKVSAAARAAKVRYVVIHEDAVARPDIHTTAAKALAAAWPERDENGLGPLASAPAAGADLPGVTVYRLW